MSSVKAYLELARWPNALMAAAGVMVGAYFLSTTEASTVGFAHPWHIVIVAIAAIALTSTANAWNDAADAEIDRQAHPGRPVPSGGLSVSAARRVALSSAIVAVALTSIVDLRLAGLTLVVVLLMLAYSPWIKRIALLGNVLAAALASLPFLYGAWATGDPGQGGAFLSLWAFPLHFAREIAKDIDDAKADAGHRSTIPLGWGASAARTLAVLALACFFALFPFPVGWWPGLFWSMLPAYACVVVGGVRIAWGRPGAPSALKAAMFLAMIAAVLSTAVPGLRPLLI